MDITKKILRLLKEGNTQQQISDIFKYQGIKPNSLSTIEKYLKQIREDYKAKSLFHLAYILIEDQYNFEDDEENTEF